jgi:hypothetical protein
MKRIFLFFTALLIGMAAAQSAKAQLCPNPPWDPFTSGSSVVEIVYNGCTIKCTFCYGIINDYHCVALAQISVKNGCDTSIFENNKQAVTDAILIAIGKKLMGDGWLEYQEFPPCPQSLCLLRIYDAICYHGWKEINGFWEMLVCQDDQLRSCNEVVRICWELINGEQVLVVQREGTIQGPPCPLDENDEPCNNSCGQ